MSDEVHLGPAPREGEHRGYRRGERYFLVARVAGELHCIDDWCNHAGCLLSDGDMDRGVVTCPCHGARFRLTDGVNVTEPVIYDDQTPFEVVEREGQVYWRSED